MSTKTEKQNQRDVCVDSHTKRLRKAHSSRDRQRPRQQHGAEVVEIPECSWQLKLTMSCSPCPVP
jgi:hypothetical protein